MLDSGDNRARRGTVAERKVGQRRTRGEADDRREPDELVQLAAGAGDPAVYAMAVYACGILSAPAGGSCSRISLSAWAALDPGNAVPWLSLAAAARANHDAAAEADAFARAAAPAASMRTTVPPFICGNRHAEGDDAAGAPVLSVELMGVMAALPTPYRIASMHCTAEALLQATCTKNATHWPNSWCAKERRCSISDSAKVSGELGWRSSGSTPGAGTRRVARRRRSRVPHDAKEGWSCSAAERTNAYLGRFDALGELGAAREILERSGETVPSMALKWKAYWEQLRRIRRQVQEDQPQDVSR